MYTLYASCACTERQAIFRYNQTENDRSYVVFQIFEVNNLSFLF